MTEIVVVAFKQKRKLTLFRSQFRQLQEVVLCKFASPFLIDVYFSDGASIKILCTAQLLDFMLLACWCFSSIREVSDGGEAEEVGFGEAEGS